MTKNGRYVLVLMKADIPNFVIANRLKGTVEENQAVAQGVYFIYGSYTVKNEKEGKVILHSDGSSYPNWTGLDQERIFTITGDKLRQTIPQAAIGEIHTIIWKRIK
jgi:hypothetical protein